MKQLLTIILLLSTLSMLGAQISLTQSRGNQLTIDFHVEDYTIVEEDGFSHIRMKEAAYPIQSGAPSLPTLEFKIGIPPHGDARYTILSTTKERIQLPSRLVPVPTLGSENGISTHDYRIDESLYTQSTGEIIESLGTKLFREHPYVPFQIKPFIYDGHRSLEIIKSMRILITLDGDLDAKSPMRDDPMSDIILAQMLNSDDAKSWRQSTRVEIQHADFSRSPWWYRIETDRAGMYRINPSQLQDWPLSEIDPRSFRIFSTFGKLLPMEPVYQGEEFTEIPIFVHGEEDGNFDSSDFIAFWGIDRNGYEINSSIQTDSAKIYHNPYSENVVYWLTFAGDFDAPPLRIQAESALANFNHDVDSHPEIVHIEEESHRRDIKGYTWYMSRLFGSSTMDYAFDVNLSDVDLSEEGILEMRLHQELRASNLTHSISVFVNGEIVSSTLPNTDIHQWIGTSIFNFSNPSSAFRSGNNRILIRVIRPGTTSNLFLDYITVKYHQKMIKSNRQYIANAFIPVIGQGVKYNFSGSGVDTHVFKISSPSTISKLPISLESDGFSFTSTGGANTRFAIAKYSEFYSPANIESIQPVDLTDLSSPIQSLIITPPEFHGQAAQLADIYWQNWQLHTKVVADIDIFNQFNGGNPDPAAIRQYLRYVFHNGQDPKLQSVTLLGLGTIDWRNFSRAAAAKNKMMIFQHASNSITSDDYFAMLTGNRHPEIAIGRYPVTNSNELSIMISNLIQYTQSPEPGLWRNSLVSLADDRVNGTNTNEWIHTEDMQALSDMIHPSVINDKIFAEEYDYDEFLNKPWVRDRFFDSINDGRLIWYYIGHGSYDKLGMQNYFTASTDMGRFQNQNKLGLFIAASCEVSMFDYWPLESLGQKTVLMNGIGAIASVASTRKSFPAPNHQLMRRFIPNMVNDYMNLGLALTAAKISYTSSIDNDAMYIIFGDPNLEIIPPRREDSLNLQVASKEGSQNSTVHARQLASFEGSFEQATINNQAQFLAFDSMRPYQIGHLTVSKRGPQIYRGTSTVENSAFNASFFIPDDIQTGDTALTFAYVWDAATKQDYLSYYSPMSLSSDVLPGSTPNDSPPEISIHLESLDFRPGDTVGIRPTLYGKISDENGINVTGSNGREMLLIIDNSLQPIPVSDYFVYDTDSPTTGTLAYPMPVLSEGYHSVQLIAFDNFNLPSVAETHFIVKDSGPISLQNLLPYPNPMKDGGHITFLISSDADITLDLFTMSGRRIRRIETFARSGFNSIPFDGRDEFGKKLANNTYFLRVRAKNLDGKTTEKRERLVIYK